jgi:hypothetical protein
MNEETCATRNVKMASRAEQKEFGLAVERGIKTRVLRTKVELICNLIGIDSGLTINNHFLTIVWEAR